MELWVGLSIAGAFLQNLRSALQKTLTGRVGLPGAAYARFVFAAPWAVLAAMLLNRAGVPDPTQAFAAWAATGAFAQIAGTFLLLAVFGLRNFAVGNAFSKTETVQAALFGLVLLGDRIGPLPLAGILVSLVGVLLLSAAPGMAAGTARRAAGLGIASGAAFAVSAVAYRGATQALAGPADFAGRAAFTLACVTVVQTVAMTLWMSARSPGVAPAVLRSWRLAAPVGLAGMLASLCWFTAFALVSAAQVKAVGQVELAFSYLTSRLAFGERPSRRETTGMLLLAAGILVLVLASG